MLREDTAALPANERGKKNWVVAARLRAVRLFEQQFQIM